jgi:hypothetical protein
MLLPIGCDIQMPHVDAAASDAGEQVQMMISRPLHFSSLPMTKRRCHV